jgi:hypothetical protein
LTRLVSLDECRTFQLSLKDPEAVPLASSCKIMIAPFKVFYDFASTNTRNFSNSGWPTTTTGVNQVLI